MIESVKPLPEMTLSVIICTHNPRSDHLGRVLDALKAQTLPKEQWELLLVDNASNQSLSEKWDLTWHPNGRHIREEQLGKTPALRSVVPQAKASVLITVDDDNILAPDYLKWALKKMDQHAEVGVWSGTIVAEFERNPASWKQAFFPYMAINQENEDRISKDLESAPLPIGAGMVFRRELAQEYKLWMDPTTQIGKNGLSRRGSRLYAGEEDTELGIIAIRNGYACGRTPDLRMTHLMPQRRISARYLFRIARDISYSHALIYRRHGLQRGQMSTRELIRQFVRSSLLVALGAVSGNAERFGRGMVGISSLCGIGARFAKPRTLAFRDEPHYNHFNLRRF